MSIWPALRGALAAMMAAPMAENPLTVIARVRRAMPRNADVMAICDALEVTLHKPEGHVTPEAVTLRKSGCPVCEARRAADAARARRHRAKTVEAAEERGSP